MDARRRTLVGGVGLAVIAGIAAVNLALWAPPREPWSARAADAAVAARTAVPAVAGDDAGRAAPRPLFVPPLDEPARFPPLRLSPLRSVAAVSAAEGDPSAPSELPATELAVPLPLPAAASDAEILSVIDEELPGAAAMEREVWLEELRGLPAVVMRRILRLWQEEHGAARDPIALDDVRPGEMPLRAGSFPIFALESDFDREQLIARLAPSLEAIGEARDVILNNVANAATVGFKRSEVLFGEAAALEQRVCCEDGLGRFAAVFRHSGGEGAGVACVRLDVSPGPIDRTGRPLDVAIAGDGFFQVSRRGELLLTRAGRFTRAADGRLVLAGPSGAWALEPPVVIPEETAEVRIARDGAVLVRLAGQDSPFEAGRILLARCADPTGLHPRGDSLFEATTESGAPQPGRPGHDGLGKLRQAALEQSNVDLERESAEWRRLHARTELLAEITSRSIPFASARPLHIVAAPPDQGEPGDADGAAAGGLIGEYLRTRQQAERLDGPEFR